MKNADFAAPIANAKPERPGPKAAYSERAVALFDPAARIARAEEAEATGVDHLLAAFAGENDGLMGKWKRERGITSAGWRTAIGEFRAPAPAAATVRDYLTPEEAAGRWEASRRDLIASRLAGSYLVSSSSR